VSKKTGSTSEEVESLWQPFLRTISANVRRLGGFYPAGIRALRFRREDIYAIMEGPQERTLELPVSTPGPALRQIRVPGQENGSSGNGKTPREIGGSHSADSSIIADSIDPRFRDTMRLLEGDLLNAPSIPTRNLLENPLELEKRVKKF
jgi:hypothetical protein